MKKLATALFMCLIFDGETLSLKFALPVACSDLAPSAAYKALDFDDNAEIIIGSKKWTVKQYFTSTVVGEGLVSLGANDQTLDIKTVTASPITASVVPAIPVEPVVEEETIEEAQPGE